MAGSRLRLPLALATTVVAAGAATLILRPRSGLIDPAAVDVTAYFRPAQVERAADFRDLQRVIGIGQLAVSAVVLGVLALRPPGRVGAVLARLGKRPVRGGAAAGAVLSLVLTVTGLPLAWWAHERAVDYGLSTQSLGPWLGDTAKTAGISLLFAAVGATLAVGLARRFPRHWWVPGGGVVVGLAVLSIYLWPVAIDPLFNKFEPLPRGPLRSEVLRLADRAGVDVGQVYRVDASRRTTAINAYVVGLGHTKRVVIYDNLIDGYPSDQVRSVVAHELGHVESRDVPRGLVWVLIVAFPGVWLVQLMAERITSARGVPAALPALALALGLVSLGLTSAGNALSRPVEARADAFALGLTDDPKAFIALERSLAVRNLGDPDPPAAFQLLFGTHPTTKQRIGFGEAWKAGEGR
ncbi:MAG: M48 family metallopeptidase [Thermoleophilaceae bacterium]